MKFQIEVDLDNNDSIGHAITKSEELISFIKGNFPPAASLGALMAHRAKERGQEGDCILLESFPDEDGKPTDSNCMARMTVRREGFDKACLVPAQAKESGSQCGIAKTTNPDSIEVME